VRQNYYLDERMFMWNAQKDIFRAKNLEIVQRVAVKYRGFERDAIVAGLEQSITLTRWLITIALARP